MLNCLPTDESSVAVCTLGVIRGRYHFSEDLGTGLTLRENDKSLRF